jgi:hypothetical protein
MSRAVLVAAPNVPQELSNMSLEDMRELAFRLVDFIDGPAPIEERIRYLPEYDRLVERINFRTEASS